MPTDPFRGHIDAETMIRQAGENLPPSMVPHDRYSPDHFYTRATDNRGHSREFRVPVPQDLGALVEMCWRAIPDYRSPADFIRDAIIHRGQYLADSYGRLELTDGLVRQRVMAELERMEIEQEQEAVYVARMNDVLDEEIARGSKRGVALAAINIATFMEHSSPRYHADMERMADTARRWLESQTD